MQLVLLGLAVFLGGGFLSWMVPQGLRSKLLAVAALAGAGLIGWVSVDVLLSGHALSLDLFFPFPLEKVPFVLDPLAAFFSLLIAIGGTAASFYTISYLKPYEGKSRMAPSHSGLVLFLLAAMILVVLVQHALAFLIVWEIMSLVSFLLVFFENEKPEVVEASLYYLVAMHVGRGPAHGRVHRRFDARRELFLQGYCRGLGYDAFSPFLRGLRVQGGFFPSSYLASFSPSRGTEQRFGPHVGRDDKDRALRHSPDVLPRRDGVGRAGSAFSHPFGRHRGIWDSLCPDSEGL